VQLSTPRPPPPLTSVTETLWGQGGSESAVLGARDVISVMTITDGLCPLTVSIGDQSWYFEAGCQGHVSYFEVPFNSWTVGPVSATLNGKLTHGPPFRTNVFMER